jgi:hypothetical protein
MKKKAPKNKKRIIFSKTIFLLVVLMVVVLFGSVFFWLNPCLFHRNNSEPQKTVVNSFEQEFQITEPKGNITVTSSPEFVIKGTKSAAVANLSLIIDYNWSGIYIPNDSENTWSYKVSLHPGSNEYQIGVYDSNQGFLGSKDISINYDDQRIKTEREICLSSLSNMSNFDLFANYNESGDNVYINKNWGISFNFPNDWSGCTVGLTSNSHNYDYLSAPLYNIQLNGVALKIFGQEYHISHSGNDVADFLLYRYPVADFTVNTVQSDKGKDYEIEKKDGSLIDDLYFKKFLHFFERDGLIFVVEVAVQENVSQEQNSGYKKIIDSFNFIKTKQLPVINISLKNYKVQDCRVFVSTGEFNLCDFGLKCVGVSFCQDGGELVSVDYADRYDFSNFNILRDDLKSYLSQKVINKINSGEISGYDNNNIYLKEGDLVYIINFGYFENNMKVLKEFSF